MAKSFPEESGFHVIDISEYLTILYKFDCEIFNNPPTVFPFESEQELYHYLMEEHNTVTYIYNDKKGKTIGYFSYEVDNNMGNMTELINIGVHPKFQGKGYANEIMKYYLTITEGKDSRLVTHPNNKIARKLYEKHGYKPVKLIKNYFGDGEDRVLYFRSV